MDPFRALANLPRALWHMVLEHVVLFDVCSLSRNDDLRVMRVCWLFAFGSAQGLTVVVVTQADASFQGQGVDVSRPLWAKSGHCVPHVKDWTLQRVARRLAPSWRSSFLKREP